MYSTFSHAALTIDVVESGGDVVASASGSVNTTDLVQNVNWSSIGSFVRGSASGADGQIILAPVNAATAIASYTISTNVAFSTGPVIYASFSSGDRVGFLSTSGASPPDLIYLETDYVSNTPISSTATWSGQTFADLGLIQGTYVVTWGAAPNADSLTLNIGTAPPTPTYSVGGTVSGLTGTGLALQNNASDTLAIAADGPFTFSTKLVDDAVYAVTVSVQPTGQTCSVTNGSGVIAAADVTNIAVTCVDIEVPTYSVGGTVSGLTGTGLALQNNSAEILAVGADGPFAFLNELEDAAAYAVEVSTQPTGQTCIVTNGSGVIAAADVTNIAVTCVDDVVVPPTPAMPVPTLSQWALIMLSMFLGLMVFTNRRSLF
jgi:hypothetical protein